MATLSLAKVWLVGRLVNDPELKTTKTGKSVCTIRVAVNRPSGASFFSVTLWEKKAEMVSAYFRKGNNICIIGDLSSRTYQNSNGVQVTSYEVSATEVKFVDTKSTEDRGYERAALPSVEGRPSSGGFEEVPDDEDLPF